MALLTVLIHRAGCRWETGSCTCTPTEFKGGLTDRQALLEAHGGDSGRVEMRPGVLPFRMPDVPEHRSQARRHLRAISD